MVDSLILSGMLVNNGPPATIFAFNFLHLSIIDLPIHSEPTWRLMKHNPPREFIILQLICFISINFCPILLEALQQQSTSPTAESCFLETISEHA